MVNEVVGGLSVELQLFLYFLFFELSVEQLLLLQITLELLFQLQLHFPLFLFRSVHSINLDLFQVLLDFHLPLP